jgi:signal transduction histidine kinase
VSRLRPSAGGLRARIVGAVLITAVVTLLVAALTLLPRLESSLRSASLNTLKSEVRDARRAGEIKAFIRLPYILVPDLANPQLRRAARQEARDLSAAETRLADRLGATGVTLIGFIDRQGRGHPIDVTPGDSDAGSSIGLRQVAAAYLTGSPQFSFGAAGDTVRAAVPLRQSGYDAVLFVRKSIDQIPGAVHAVGNAFALAAMAGLVLTLVLAFPLAGTLVGRLRRLRAAALRVAVEGTGAEFPVDRARDEVGDLARSFAIMQRRLRQQEEARRAFVATASHELRTPLTSLDGMLELLGEELLEEQPDLEDAAALVDRARAQSRRLGRLAADLLDLSRIDADVPLRSEPVELAELCRAVMAEFDLATSERGVTAVLHGSDGPVWALGDPGSVARILRILLDNALRVAPRGSRIRVILASAPRPRLSVVDDGPGVAAQERELIFQRFQRGRETGGEAGFGLGLAIGRELAERMHGTLVLDPDDPDAERGASFSLTLPRADAPVEEAEPSAATA